MAHYNNRDWNQDVSNNIVPGAESFTLQGAALMLKGAATSHLYDGGAVALPYAAGSEQIELVSTDAADTLAGTGARKAEVVGLDDNFEDLSEIVDLTGLVPASTINSFRRLFKVQVCEAGTTETNLGTITAAGAISTDEHAHMIPGVSVTRLGTFTVPDGKTAIVLQLYWEATQIAKRSLVGMSMFSRDPAPNSPWVLEAKSFLDTEISDKILLNNPVGRQWGPRTDFKFEYSSSEDALGSVIAHFVVEDA